MRVPDGKRISNARLKPKGDISGALHTRFVISVKLIAAVYEPSETNQQSKLSSQQKNALNDCLPAWICMNNICSENECPVCWQARQLLQGQVG